MFSYCMEIQETPINKKQNWENLKQDYLTLGYTEFAGKYSAGEHKTHLGRAIVGYLFILVLRILFSIWSILLFVLYLLI